MMGFCRAVSISAAAAMECSQLALDVSLCPGLRPSSSFVECAASGSVAKVRPAKGFFASLKVDRLTVRASSPKESGDKVQTGTENVPGWAKPDSGELPPWARNERSPQQEPPQDMPFGVYLIGSALVAIAAVGSVFEYFNKNAIFGVISDDSPFYAPILGFFAITGLPTTGFLFYKSIQLANKASEEADREDGVRR